MRINIDEITITVKSHLDEHAKLHVIDESHQHKGHKGHNPEVGVTHVAINLVWESFEELTLIERHRLANTWLDSFFKRGLHAVQYSLKTPNECTAL